MKDPLSIQKVLENLYKTQEFLDKEARSLQNQIEQHEKEAKYYQNQTQSMPKKKLRYLSYRPEVRAQDSLSEAEHAKAELQPILDRLEKVKKAIGQANYLISNPNYLVSEISTDSSCANQREVAIKHLANINHFLNPTENPKIRIFPNVLLWGGLVVSVLSFLIMAGIGRLALYGSTELATKMAMGLLSVGLSDPVMIGLIVGGLVIAAIGGVLHLIANVRINPANYTKALNEECAAVEKIFNSSNEMNSVVAPHPKAQSEQSFGEGVFAKPEPKKPVLTSSSDQVSTHVDTKHL